MISLLVTLLGLHLINSICGTFYHHLPSTLLGLKNSPTPFNNFPNTKLVNAPKSLGKRLGVLNSWPLLSFLFFFNILQLYSSIFFWHRFLMWQVLSTRSPHLPKPSDVTTFIQLIFPVAMFSFKLLSHSSVYTHLFLIKFVLLKLLTGTIWKLSNKRNWDSKENFNSLHSWILLLGSLPGISHRHRLLPYHKKPLTLLPLKLLQPIILPIYANTYALLIHSLIVKLNTKPRWIHFSLPVLFPHPSAKPIMRLIIHEASTFCEFLTLLDAGLPELFPKLHKQLRFPLKANKGHYLTTGRPRQAAALPLSPGHTTTPAIPTFAAAPALLSASRPYFSTIQLGDTTTPAGWDQGSIFSYINQHLATSLNLQLSPTKQRIQLSTFDAGAVYFLLPYFYILLVIQLSCFSYCFTYLTL